MFTAVCRCFRLLETSRMFTDMQQAHVQNKRDFSWPDFAGAGSNIFCPGTALSPISWPDLF